MPGAVGGDPEHEPELRVDHVHEQDRQPAHEDHNDVGKLAQIHAGNRPPRAQVEVPDLARGRHERLDLDRVRVGELEREQREPEKVIGQLARELNVDVFAYEEPIERLEDIDCHLERASQPAHEAREDGEELCEK